MKKTITAILAAVCLNAYAQQPSAIEAKSIAEIYSENHFDPSWQYLTTKIYPVNLQNLKQEFENIGHKTKNIKSIFVSTKLIGNAINNVEYPLYNFKIEGKQTTTNNFDDITIIEGLPVDIKEINAEINIEEIEETKNIYAFVANQLDNISQMSNPLFAAKLVGELGSLIKAQNEEKAFKFTNTIKIFDNNSKTQKIHSILVYVIQPAGIPIPQNNDKFQNLKNEIKNNIQINSQILRNELNRDSDPYHIDTRPYIFVVNYLTQYKSELKLKDYTQEEINLRLSDIQAKQVNQEIYNYEKRLSEYLTEVSLMKSEIAEFKQTKSENKLLNILSRYKAVNYIYNNLGNEYKNDKVFDEIFRDNYNLVFKTAQQSLQVGNEDLNYVHNVMPYLLEGKITSNYDRYENILDTLDNHKFTSEESSNDENVIKIGNMINEIEGRIYQKQFRPLIDDIYRKESITRDSSASILQTTTSNCQMCMERRKRALDFYNNDMIKENMAQNNQQIREKRRTIDQILYSILDKEDKLANTFRTYPVPAQTSALKHKMGKLEKLQEERSELEKKLNELDNDNDDQIRLLSEYTGEAENINDKIDDLMSVVQPYTKPTEEAVLETPANIELPSTSKTEHKKTNNKYTYDFSNSGTKSLEEARQAAIINNAQNITNEFEKYLKNYSNEIMLYYESARNTYLALKAYIDDTKQYSAAALLNIENLTDKLEDSCDELEERFGTHNKF